MAHGLPCLLLHKCPMIISRAKAYAVTGSQWNSCWNKTEAQKPQKEIQSNTGVLLVDFLVASKADKKDAARNITRKNRCVKRLTPQAINTGIMRQWVMQTEELGIPTPSSWMFFLVLPIFNLIQPVYNIGKVLLSVQAYKMLGFLVVLVFVYG